MRLGTLRLMGSCQRQVIRSLTIPYTYHTRPYSLCGWIVNDSIIIPYHSGPIIRYDVMHNVMY